MAGRGKPAGGAATRLWRCASGSAGRISARHANPKTARLVANRTPRVHARNPCMCGIAGILALGTDNQVDESQLRAMAGQLRHRGPDDEGYYIDPQKRCGLAFRRLAIIDLATGNQPIANEDETVWLVFNGEI